MSVLVIIVLLTSALAPALGVEQLFAVLGGSSCAEGLRYGPQSITTSGSQDGLYQYYFSTGTQSKDVPHTKWLQIVTGDGSTELFRVYWTFSTEKTLSQRFVSAVTSGEAVNYRVVDASNSQEYSYSGTWRYSSTSGVIASKFTVGSTTCCFSADDGVWGAGTGTINGDGNTAGYSSTSFWGIGNWDSTQDSSCPYVYKNGVQYTNYGLGAKTYMYYDAEVPPSAEPTAEPTFPTHVPTLLPTTRMPTVLPTTRMPTQFPTLGGQQVLFAVLSGTQCAEQLRYGPQAITTAGSADGLWQSYLSTSTASKNVLHTQWLQVVTVEDGVGGNREYFRIYWTFDTARTLANHFVTAVQSGVAVSYVIEDLSSNGVTYTRSGTWWFSNAAGITAATFEVAATTCCFSADDGVWGAGNGVIQPNANPSGVSTAAFWGIGNWDDSDASSCPKVYKNALQSAYGAGTKVYMYYFDAMSPTKMPTAQPSNPTRLPTAVPSRLPTAAPSVRPSANPTYTPAPSASRSPSAKPTIRPTIVPTVSPTRLPSAAPSRLPTAVPTVTQTFTTTNVSRILFAVVGGSSCAETLYYGPQDITTAGSADGMRPFFLSTRTAGWFVPHGIWEQVVTSDGVTEKFRVRWTFSTAKTLAQRFGNAVVNGEPVTYTVTDASDGSTYTYEGTWWFSNSAGSLQSKFETSFTTCCFSADDGVWGGGSGTIQANGVAAPLTSTSFWGIGNWDSADNDCNRMYLKSVMDDNVGRTTKAYIYYYAAVPPTAAPTTRPTITDSKAPTTKPTVVPSVRPSTLTPTARPTVPVTSVAPTKMPTAVPTAHDQNLFAVVGGQQCAEQLPYGPLPITTAGSSGGHPYFLSTNTANRNMLHRQWLEIVTSDGTTEVFRVYWTFDTARSLAGHFTTAVQMGVVVSWRVVTAAGQEYTYQGTWRFSSSSGLQLSAFDMLTVQPSAFSADDGVWGAGNGVVDGQASNAGVSSFWGVGNFDSADSTECSKIYTNGQVYSSGGATKAYMYYLASTTPTMAPTIAPSSPTAKPTVPTPLPTIIATMAPTRVPTVEQTFAPGVGPHVLFAVVGGSQCAEGLPYGPQAITTAGAVDGTHPYFLSTSTAAKDMPHKYWTQIVTSDGVNEIFRIYWTFDTARTLADHFVTAVQSGVVVNYKVVSSGQEYTYQGTWRFSDGSGITSATFSTPVTGCCFSADDGAWGAGNGVINANGNANGYSSSFFWGVGNWDTSDPGNCAFIFMAGQLKSNFGSNIKAFMYYSAISPEQSPPVPLPASASPMRVPTRAPTRAPTFAPTRAPTRFPTARPTATPSLQSSASPENAGQGLFAVLGSDQCAEGLFYGPQGITVSGSADGVYRNYLSTSTAARYTLHSQWMQVVTSDGVNEIFRIYWNFDTARTLADHFVIAVQSGVTVSWRVVTSAGVEYNYQGTWWFSNTAGITASKFDVTSTTCCFSADDGAWGGGYGTIQANGITSPPSGSSFWGIGNWDGGDSPNCGVIYQSGVPLASNPSSRTYMYFVLGGGALFTRSPTRQLTRAPTTRPTAAATPVSGYELFAVLGAGGCAESLPFGTAVVTEQGAALDGYYPFFLSTSAAPSNFAHTEWLQIVTTDGYNEAFRIYWTFTTPRTMKDRFAQAVTVGELVSWTIVAAGESSVTVSGNWRYSSKSSTPLTAFDTTAPATCCFSADDGAWGAGSSVDGGWVPGPSSFWGIGNFASTDSTCDYIYKGPSGASRNTGAKVYMYYKTSGVPTQQPTAGPVVKAQVTQEISGVDYASYQSNPSGFETVIKRSIVDAVAGISEEDIEDFAVSDGSSGRRLRQNLHTADAANAPGWRPAPDSIEKLPAIHTDPTPGPLSISANQADLTALAQSRTAVVPDTVGGLHQDPTPGPQAPTADVGEDQIEATSGERGASDGQLSAPGWRPDGVRDYDAADAQQAAPLVHIDPSPAGAQQVDAVSVPPVIASEIDATAYPDLGRDTPSHAHMSTTAASLIASYKIALVHPGVTFDSVLDQLRSSVESGLFDESLHTHAAAENVPALMNVTSKITSLEQIVEQSDDGSGSDDDALVLNLSLAAVVGIAIGVGAGLIVTIAACIYFCRRPAPAANTQGTGFSPTNDPSLVKDINSYFYGTGLPREGGADALRQAMVPTAPTAPMDTRDIGVEMGGLNLGADATAPPLESLYPNDPGIPSQDVETGHLVYTIPVAAVATPAYGPTTGDVVIAELYTGEVEETKRD